MFSHVPRARTRPPGFTLIECLVAIILVNVGIVALMTATTFGARAVLASRQRAAASRTALNRVDWLLARGCSGAASSGDTAAAFAPNAAERWSVTDPAPGIREVQDSVSYVGADPAHAVVIRARTLC